MLKAKVTLKQRKKLLLQEQERLRNTLFEYTISDQEKVIFQIDELIEQLRRQELNITETDEPN